MSDSPELPSGFEVANSTKGMAENVQYHQINIMFGAVCFSLNIPLFILLVTSKTLRAKSQVLIALCIADAVNCLAILFMGINRVTMYSAILETNLLPVRGPWTCALEPWLWLRGIGDLWPPVIQLMMGLERFFAVYTPWVYMKVSKNRGKIMIIPTVVFVVLALGVGFFLAYRNRYEKALYYCGRKAAFSSQYGVFIYGTNIAGYGLGLLLNVVALVRASGLVQESSQRQFRKIRYTLAIALLSTVLVSTPNLISLMSALLVNIADAISKPSTYFTCVNSGINIFVYMLLNTEFRERVLSICSVTRNSVHITLNKTLFVSTSHRNTDEG